MKSIEYYINQNRIVTANAFQLALKVEEQKATIKNLVNLIDELRAPYNNSKRSDLYWLATNKLNDLQERELI